MSSLKEIISCSHSLQRAREFAAKKHAEVNQTYDGLPYVEGHLDKVVSTVLKYSSNVVLLRSAYGHDLKEDTLATKEEIIENIGLREEEIISLLTDGPGNTRFERQFLTYVNMRNDVEAVLVKVCDRITNISQSFGTRYSFMYVNEHERFKGSLYSRHDLTEQAWCDLEELYVKLKNHMAENQDHYIELSSKK